MYSQLGQTGDDKLDVRIGGIYALGRIARDSKVDRGPIIEVLTAFLRQHTRRAVPAPAADDDLAAGAKEDASATGREVDPGLAELEHRAHRRLRADFEAAISVIVRGNWARDYVLDLSDAHLPGAHFSLASLEGAIFAGAHLEEASFLNSHLERADFFGAHLDRALFEGANLKKANFTHAHLENANLAHTDLQGASFHYADIEGADFLDAHVKGTRGLGPEGSSVVPP